MVSKQEELFFEIHQDNPREGPGNFESTKKAFSMLNNLPKSPRILDIGCGPGRQTLDLAQISLAIIHAMDTYDDYLDNLNRHIQKNNLTSRISPVKGDMGSLKFEKEYFDIIWAEGSIYIIGFEKGLKSWKPYLKPKGYTAVTEISWLNNDAPEDIRQYWNDAYPAMKTIKENLAIIREVGYNLIGYFVLPENAWWDDYYNHIENKIDNMRDKYANDPDALEVMDEELQEMDMYRQYSEYYGYVFYVMQK